MPGLSPRPARTMMVMRQVGDRIIAVVQLVDGFNALSFAHYVVVYRSYHDRERRCRLVCLFFLL